ncbi:MAG: HD-GYP domain-containing protein, partial [Chthonomonadaceae bacterium]|nr:HD-GYP domain-containing protein [Chthonomonadaceae bacterium]
AKRDSDTDTHNYRVTFYAVALAEAMCVPEAEISDLVVGAFLHDVGKIGIPDSILLKEGKLTDDEYAIMKKHPEFAFEMLKPIPFLADCLDIPLHHHERWDGNGYPHKLSGTEIPLLARVFAVADVWDALRSDRPYRSAWSEEQTRQHIERSSGTHLDPTVVEAFLSLEPMPHPSDERFKDNRAA